MLLRQLDRTRNPAEVSLWPVTAIDEIELCLGILNYRTYTPAFIGKARPVFRSESVTFNPDCITKTLGKRSFSIFLGYTWVRSGKSTNLHDSYRAASGFVKWRSNRRKSVGISFTVAVRAASQSRKEDNSSWVAHLRHLHPTDVYSQLVASTNVKKAHEVLLLPRHILAPVPNAKKNRYKSPLSSSNHLSGRN